MSIIKKNFKIFDNYYLIPTSWFLFVGLIGISVFGLEQFNVGWPRKKISKKYVSEDNAYYKRTHVGYRKCLHSTYQLMTKVGSMAKT